MLKSSRLKKQNLFTKLLVLFYGAVAMSREAYSIKQKQNIERQCLAQLQVVCRKFATSSTW